MKYINTILVFAMCYTLNDLKDIECKTWCKMNSYDSGVFTKEQCWCADKVEQERISEKKLNLPKKNTKKQSSFVPWNYPFQEITKLPWE